MSRSSTVPSGSHQIGRLVEIFIRKIVRGPLGAIDIIAEGGEALARSRQRATKLHAVQRHAALLRQDFFKTAAILAPAFDDLFHDSLRSFGLARADAVAHIDDHIAIFDDADSIIVESQNLQVASPLRANFGISLRQGRQLSIRTRAQSCHGYVASSFKFVRVGVIESKEETCC